MPARRTVEYEASMQSRPESVERSLKDLNGVCHAAGDRRDRNRIVHAAGRYTGLVHVKGTAGAEIERLFFGHAW